MLASLSSFLMVFLDRVFLSWYSNAAFRAAVNAGNFCSALIYGLITIGSITIIFISREQGAGKTKQLGRWVWQLFWTFLASFLLFIPMAIFGGGLLFSGSTNEILETEFFSYFSYLAPFFILIHALQGFFIGQGKTLMVTILAVLGNAINVGLDYVFIFGVQGLCPALGILGAFLSTFVSLIFQIAILAIVFLNKENREEKGTLQWQFQPQLLAQCLKVAMPEAMLWTVDSLLLAFFYASLVRLGDKAFTLMGIGLSICYLFYSFGDGIYKGATSLAGNYLGARRPQAALRLMREGAKLHLAFGCLLALLVFWDASIFIYPFTEVDKLGVHLEELRFSFFVLTLYVVLEGLRWLVIGLLAASKDTFMPMIVSLLIAALIFLPTTVGIGLQAQSVHQAWYFCCLYAFLNIIFGALRFFRSMQKEIASNTASS